MSALLLDASSTTVVASAAWAIVAAVMTFGYAKCLYRGDLQRACAYAMCNVTEVNDNRTWMFHILLPSFATVLCCLVVKHAENPIVASAASGIGLGAIATVAFDSIRYPIAHDLGTLMMAICGMVLLMTIGADPFDLAGWTASIAVGYVCHFARGPEVNPTTNVKRHTLWSLGHAGFQFGAFFFTVRMTVQ